MAKNVALLLAIYKPKTMADVTAGRQEKEPVKAEKKDKPLPEFMTQEN